MKKYQNLSKILMLSAIGILSVFCLFGCGTQQTETNALEDMALLDIVDKIYEATPVDLALGTFEMDITDPDALSFNAGLTNIDNVKEAVISEPMMGSQAYSLVLVRVNDEKNTAAVANEMKAGIDTAKWICVQADDLNVVSHHDVIMLFMVSSDLSDTVTSQKIIDAFKQVCGGEITSY